MPGLKFHVKIRTSFEVGDFTHPVSEIHDILVDVRKSASGKLQLHDGVNSAMDSSPLEQENWDLPSHLPGEGPDDDVTLDIVSNDSVSSIQVLSNHEKKPIAIPGTNITLVTEEDIAKWIEERRKKWPTNRNIEMKKEEVKKRRLDTPTTSDSFAKRQKQICRYFQQHGTCKFGLKCKNIHELAHETGSYYLRDVNGIAVKIPKLYSNRQGIAFADLLLQQEHTELENDQILQFVQRLDNCGLIDHDALKVKPVDSSLG